MGLFDTITFNCPNCGKELDAQSKSGECSLGIFKHISVPISVAYDANRHAPFKCECGKIWCFSNIPENIEKRISLELNEYNGND